MIAIISASLFCATILFSLPQPPTDKLGERIGARKYQDYSQRPE
jgi:hypothetical protein